MNADDTTLPDIILPDSKWEPSLDHVYAKTNWAKRHFDALDVSVKRWIKSRPYVITEEDDPDRVWHGFIIKADTTSDVALIAGDFINCLRSALDQLAWNLVHLCPDTVPKTDGAARQVVFPICEKDATYTQKRLLFSPAIAQVLDSFQPKDRTNAFRYHPLWQLDKLWNIDKHRMVAANCCRFQVTMRGGIKGRIDNFEDRVVVLVPCLARFYYRPVYVEPRITPQVLFGEHMGSWEITISDLRNIYDFVAHDVIPKFACFFPQTPSP
jgi:hypothetical protein